MASRTDFRLRLAAFLNRDLKELRSQLVVNMTALEAHLAIANATDFDREYEVPRNRVVQLERDTWVDLSRKHLQKLYQLEARVRAFSPDFRLFELRVDPLWETFATSGLGFVGKDLNGLPVEVDHYLLGAISTAGLSLGAPDSDQDVLDAMRTRNCVFVGSPKCNDATEIGPLGQRIEKRQGFHVKDLHGSTTSIITEKRLTCSTPLPNVLRVP
jgi:hypothetical protein